MRPAGRKLSLDNKTISKPEILKLRYSQMNLTLPCGIEGKPWIIMHRNVSADGSPCVKVVESHVAIFNRMLKGVNGKTRNTQAAVQQAN